MSDRRIVLNKQQEEAASHRNGPCMVVAVPGSGKSRLLVERVGRMVEEGIDPKHIVCVTFTNKAADELKQRIARRLNVNNLKCYVGTFHSLCVRILRKFGTRINYNPDFTIIDADEQKEMIGHIARRLEIPIEKKEQKQLIKAINDQRENLWDDDEFMQAINHNYEWNNIAIAYFDQLNATNSLDFSGLLAETVRLIENDSEVRDRIQSAFCYGMIDEAQDTNIVQFRLIDLLFGKYNNIMLTGDVSQCVDAETNIITQSGDKKAHEIQVGDNVKCGVGHGEVDYKEVKNVYKRFISNNTFVKITTQSGREIITTPDHIVFAGFKGKVEISQFCVYLMKKEEYGYRIGITSQYDSNSNKNSWEFRHRIAGEVADYIWIVDVADTEKEARFLEQYYAIQYGIPTWTFMVYSNNINNYCQENISRLFDSINTESRAKRMADDICIDLSYPHYIPKCSSVQRKRRRNFSIVLAGDSRKYSYGHMHRYSISGSDNDDAIKLQENGLKIRSSKKCNGWRVESSCKNMSVVSYQLDKVTSSIDCNIISSAYLSDITLPFTPSCNVFRGMKVFVDQGDYIDTDTVEKVEKFIDSRKVVDLNVDQYHNFSGNDILSHNSIYRFRSARYENIVDFLNKHSDCRRIELPLNYRSTPQIVKVADNLIRHNASHMAAKFETINEDGNDVKCLAYRNQLDEADFVADHCRKLIQNGWNPGDIAVLYRINAMSEPIERSMTKSGIDYAVIGSRSFYDRKEIKDCLAMLRIAVNPNDSIAFYRCANHIPNLGEKTVAKIEAYANENDTTMIDACYRVAKNSKSIAENSKANKAIYHLIDKLDFDKTNMNVVQILSESINRFEYEDKLRKEYESEAEERIENVNQLLNSAAEFAEENPTNSATKYLQSISLITASDKEGDENRVSLMTMHASKGLEFPVVFVIGMEQNTSPHSLALKDDPVSGVEEERRLAYVAFTRAQSLLYITYCRYRRQFSKGGSPWNKPCKPSQFLSEAGLIKSKERERSGIN